MLMMKVNEWWSILLIVCRSLGRGGGNGGDCGCRKFNIIVTILFLTNAFR